MVNGYSILNAGRREFRMDTKPRVIISSDWSECLSPNGPFDPIAFSFPEHTSALESVFRQYTGNAITLTAAVERINALIPECLSADAMDSYLDADFAMYTGAAEFITQAREMGALFVINTTGSQGYFQRALAKGLLPNVDVVAANPFIAYPQRVGGPAFHLTVTEIVDKPKNTQAVLTQTGLAPGRVMVMGDSGGDGPHFLWGAEQGCYLVGAMTKVSLTAYCQSHGISLDRRFGVSYEPGQKRDIHHEMSYDYRELLSVIQALEAR